MSNPRPGRPQNLLIDLAWFVPALAVFSLAAFVRHPAILIALLVGNGLTMIATARAAHLRRRPVDLEPLLVGGAAYTALLAAYAAVFALVAFFPSRLILAEASFAAALLLSAAVFVLLLAPWRGWPAFGLAALLDELRARRRPPGLAETIGNSVELAHRITAREDLYFPHGLVVSLALFALTLGAFAIAQIGVDLPETPRLIALAVYALLLAPLAHWGIVRASLAAILDQRDLLRPSPRRDAEPQRTPPSPDAVTATASSVSVAAPVSVARPVPVPAPAPIDQAELDARLLRHARGCAGAEALAALAQGADPNLVPDAGDRDQRSVVVLACVAQDLALLRALIAKGADINRAHAGLTPLIAATRDSYQGRPDVVVTLLTNGADPHCTDAEGNTPLHFAVRAAEPTVAALLCDASAPIDVVNREGYTPLAIACALGRGDLVRFLLERRADVHVAGAVPALIAAAASPDDNTEVVKLLLKRGARVDSADNHGRAPLAIAAQHDNADIAALLLKSGAAIDAADALGVTALMEAALAGAADTLDVLGANAPALETADHSGRTALMFAAESMYADDAFV
ncbi:MAG: ankyrin repeat domain-containing protein, partial [Proteobacteria bacterium]|nr:ankyrin repeat domain-containing protein [Pseudomonadota bacterium]